MKSQELIELLQRLPFDIEICRGTYSGNYPLDISDFVFSEGMIILPDYEWITDEPYMSLEEFLETHMKTSRVE